jgi:hypothetical protein
MPAPPRLWIMRPEAIFLVLSLAFGLVFCGLIPPLAGGNETFNFGRAAGIAYGRFLVGDVAVPGGLVQLLGAAKARFSEASALPLGVTWRFVHEMASIRLMAAAPAILPADPIAVLNPLAYLPQAAAIRLLCLGGCRPLAIFYAARLCGLLPAIWMTWLAIRRIPTHRYTLAAIALLPPLAFARSTVDADQLTVAAALLFAATVWRAMKRPAPATAAELGGLATLAFVVGQCKSAYFPLPLIVLAIPRARFAGRAHWLGWMAAIILPGIAANFLYMLALEHGFFAHQAYRTWAGDADPSAQLAGMLHAPVRYAGVLLRTLVLTPLVPLAIIQMLGTFGPPVSLPAAVIVCLAALALLVALADPTSQRPGYPAAARALGGAIFVAVLCIALTLLYIQWNGVGAPSIGGFQGRYLYPVLLLPLMSFHATRTDLFGVRAPALLVASGVFGLAAATLLAGWAYYA